MPCLTVCWSDRISPLVLLPSSFCLSLLPLCSDWPALAIPGCEAQCIGALRHSLLALMPSLRCLLPRPLCISPAWPQLWQAPMSRALDFSELSPPAATICLHLLSLKALCSHLPGLSCSGPLFHEHWILMGPALWFQYKVPIVCLPHLSAVTNLASVVVGPGAPGTLCRWALPSSFAVEFLLSVTQASRQTGLASVEANTRVWSDRSPRAQPSSFRAKLLLSVSYTSEQCLVQPQLWWTLGAGTMWLPWPNSLFWPACLHSVLHSPMQWLVQPCLLWMQGSRSLELPGPSPRFEWQVPPNSNTNP